MIEMLWLSTPPDRWRRGHSDKRGKWAKPPLHTRR